MPPPDTVLAGLTAITNDWRLLATAWHVVFGVLFAGIAAGWRPSNRFVARLLVAPLLSVSLAAWAFGNPFNGSVFGLAAVVLAATTFRLPDAPVRFAPRAWAAAGAALIAFGWAYPHFLETGSWTAYLYAAPFGLLPCPTLSLVIGATVLFRNFGSGFWSVTLIAAGLFYGVVGVFRLGVALDWGLLFGSALLAAAGVREHSGWRSVRADRRERTRPLPGDELIPAPLGSLTHAITIERPPRSVWPWLVQMGAGSRAGWYSYDVFDNGRRPSATRVVPELQRIEVGDVFPALPGVTEGFVVLAFEPDRSLILGWPGPGGSPLVTWAIVLEEHEGGATRLVVRARGAEGYRFRGLPQWLSLPAVRLAHFVMQRRQLLGIARRVEAWNEAGGSERQAGDSSRD